MSPAVPDRTDPVNPDYRSGCGDNDDDESRTLKHGGRGINDDDHRDVDRDDNGDDDDDDDDVSGSDGDFLVYSSHPEGGVKTPSTGDNYSFRIRTQMVTTSTTRTTDRCRCGRTTPRQTALLVALSLGLSLGLFGVGWSIINKRLDTDSSTDGQLEDVTPLSMANSSSQKTAVIATVRRPLFVAVLTQEKFFSTRGAACNVTWARSSYVTRVEFFTDENRSSTSSPRHNNNVTYLKGSYHDDYFHSRKTFSVIEEVCRRHAQTHDWFLFSTDDVYVRVNRLHVFLSERDPDEELYLGHKTYPVQDLAYSLLEGRPYCVSGSGIVLSRALMTGLCGVLSRCFSHPLLYPDVLLARCLRDHFNITCSGYNKLFVDAYEKREMRRLRHFLESAREAITLHPVKSRWTMTAIHSQHRETTRRQLLETLHSLEDKRRTIAKPSNIQSIVPKATTNGESQKTSKPSASQREDITVEDDAVFDENFNVYKRSWCKPKERATPALMADLRKVTHLANTSLQLGEGLQCPHLISGHYSRHERGATYAVSFLCFRARSREAHVIAHVTLERTLAPLVTKKIRRRKLQPEVVIVVSTRQDDPEVIPYLIRLDDVIKRRRERYAVYLLLRGEVASGEANESSKASFPDGDQWRAWWVGSDVKHRVFGSRDRHSSARSLQHLIRDVRTHFPEATTIVTDTSISVDSELVTRCQTLARKEKQMYYPYPVVPTTDESPDRQGPTYALVASVLRPYCLSAADLDSLLPPTESLLSASGGLPRKRLKVVRAMQFPCGVRRILQLTNQC